MPKLYVLAVDDASFIRDLIKRTLRGFFPDIQIDEAPNGRRAQSLISRNVYDLVLCDWEMPEVSGIEFLQWLREFEFNEGIDKTPFIMVTSRGDKENVVQAVEAGVNDYIGKPFSNEQLLKKVLKQLSKKHREYIQSLLSAGKGKAGTDTSNQSASILGASTAPKPASAAKDSKAGSASLLTGHSKSESLVTSTAGKSKARVRQNKGKAQLRVADASAEAVIRDINLMDILLQVPRTGRVPGLFEQAVVDIQIPDQPEELARINGFVQALSSVDRTMNSEHVLVTVHYVDDDPQKMEVLSKFIAQVR
jgi:CheY-like chemotaxis protein